MKKWACSGSAGMWVLKPSAQPKCCGVDAWSPLSKLNTLSPQCSLCSRSASALAQSPSQCRSHLAHMLSSCRISVLLALFGVAHREDGLSSLRTSGHGEGPRRCPFGFQAVTFAEKCEGSGVPHPTPKREPGIKQPNIAKASLVEDGFVLGGCEHRQLALHLFACRVRLRRCHA